MLKSYVQTAVANSVYYEEKEMSLPLELCKIYKSEIDQTSILKSVIS